MIICICINFVESIVRSFSIIILVRNALFLDRDFIIPSFHEKNFGKEFIGSYSAASSFPSSMKFL